MSRNQQPPSASNSSKQRQRRKVLTEEEYTESLSQVVQRNFFPDLPQLQETAALHDRRAAGDVAGAVAIRRSMRQRQDAEERELQQQAAIEQESASSSSAVRSTPRPLHLESLTNFHARVTSQDNADFEEQQAVDVDANRKRQALEYGRWARRLLITNNNGSSSANPALPPSNSLVASPLPLASDQFNATPHRKPIQQWAQESATSQDDNAQLFLMPGTAATTDPPLALLAAGDGTAKLKALLPADTNNTTNMPPPSALSTKVVSSLAALVEYIPKETDKKKRIEPAATRFPSAAATTTTTALSRFGSHGAATAGLNLEESESEASSVATTDYASTTDLDESPLLDLATERRLGQRRKQKELETMVAMTPVIVPGKSSTNNCDDDDDDDDEPLMTWGQVSATPLVLGRGEDNDDDNDDASGQQPTFGMTNTARDDAAERARRHMEKRSRLASATPQRKKLKRPPSIFARPTSARSASSFGTALRSSYTPLTNASAARRSSSTRAVHRATPKIRPGSTQTSTIPGKQSKDITKGLLQLS